MMVSCDALIDEVPEGPHVATVLIRTESLEQEWNDLEARVSIDITEITCPVLD
jgi:hypothetical protein